MNEVAMITAVSDKGLLGDASFGRRNRQVLRMDSETLNILGIRPGDVRENVTIEGFRLSDLSP